MNINWSSALVREIVESKRGESSLANFTKRFVDLLRQSEGQSVDFNFAAKKLSIKKRRIYDIVNILEGFDLVEKTSRNCVKWRTDNHFFADEPNHDFSQKLRSHNQALREKGRFYDQKLKSYQEELRSITQESTSMKYAYVTLSEIQEIQEFKDYTLIVIQASPGTILDVPLPKEDIKLYLRGSEKSPLVNWIYRNPNHKSFSVQELPPDNCNNILNNHQEKTTIDSLIQQTMGVPWDASLYTADILCPSTSFINQLPSCDDQVKRLQVPQPFQIEDLANTVKIPDYGEDLQDDVSNSNSSNTTKQPYDEQQVTTEIRPQPNQQLVTFEQLAMELLRLNPPKYPVPQKVTENKLSFNKSSQFPFVCNLLPQNSTQDTLQPISNEDQHTNATFKQDTREAVPSTNFDSKHSSLINFDDETLNTLSPLMSEDIYFHAMAETHDLIDFI